jgi:hypothetical protein
MALAAAMELKRSDLQREVNDVTDVVRRITDDMKHTASPSPSVILELLSNRILLQLAPGAGHRGGIIRLTHPFH